MSPPTFEGRTDRAVNDWNEIKAWRKAQRAALIARRAAVPDAVRRGWNERITALLVEGFPMLGGLTIGFCWPYQGEFDSRFAIRHWRERGATAALPEVAGKGLPLRFRKWWPGAPMAPGVYGIPVPVGTELVRPHAVLVPMNGFDEQGFRLGYGGGYFDRTLASLSPRPLAIGVGFELARLATIFPQPHDVPMDFVVTEAGIHAVRNGALAAVDAAACRERAARLLAVRGLPQRTEASAGGYSSPPCYAHEFPGYFGETGSER